MRVASGDNQDGFDYRVEALTIHDVRDLSAGLVPATLRAQALSLLDFHDHLRRNAAKPAPERRKREY